MITNRTEIKRKGLKGFEYTKKKISYVTLSTLSCSVDPYLFENFNTVDGDFLTAKFRAFKFPESTYVQFRGTVNVCLDKCQGVRRNSAASHVHRHLCQYLISSTPNVSDISDRVQQWSNWIRQEEKSHRRLKY